MKKFCIMLMALMCAIICILTGCVSEDLTWGGMKAVRQPDGTVLTDKDGKPYYEKDQNHLNRFSHLTDVEMKDFDVSAKGEEYHASLGHLSSASGSNTIGVINAGLSGTTKLVAECGVLYTKIAGGATADVATSVVSKMIAYFKSSGGDTEKATATIDDATKSVKITDGTTCVECTADGTCSTCTECTVPAAN